MIQFVNVINWQSNSIRLYVCEFFHSSPNWVNIARGSKTVADMTSVNMLKNSRRLQHSFVQATMKKRRDNENIFTAMISSFVLFQMSQRKSKFAPCVDWSTERIWNVVYVLAEKGCLGYSEIRTSEKEKKSESDVIAERRSSFICMRITFFRCTKSKRCFVPSCFSVDTFFPISAYVRTHRRRTATKKSNERSLWNDCFWRHTQMLCACLMNEKER